MAKLNGCEVLNQLVLKFFRRRYVAFTMFPVDFNGTVRQLRRVVNEKGPTTHAVSFLVGFTKESGFIWLILKCENDPSTKVQQESLILAYNGTEIVPRGQWHGGHRSEGDEETVRNFLSLQNTRQESISLMIVCC